MKHFMLLLILSIAIYGIWQVASKRARRNAIGKISFHGFRLGGLVLVLAMLLIAAASYKSFSII